MQSHHLYKFFAFIKMVFKDSRSLRFGLSFLFGLLIVLVHYLLSYLIPKENSSHHELVTVLFILISVILLFPARQALLQRIFSKYDYFIHLDHDPHHLELLAQHFSIDTLKDKFFKDFMQWLGTKSAMMAILDLRRDHFNFYTYTSGKPIKENTKDTNTLFSKSLVRYLKNKKEVLDVFDENLEQGLRTEMIRLKVSSIYPFIYRKSLTGFFVFYSQPKHPYSSRALDFFGPMAAIAIQNYILSSRVIDSQESDRELESAKRIQKIFSKTYVPKIKGYSILPRGSTRTVMEFYKTNSGSFFLVTLSVERLTGGAGIILYGMLGSLHALLHREPNITINKLLNHLRSRSDYPHNEYQIDIFITEIMHNEAEITILHEGEQYNFYEATKPKHNLLSLGWRNLIELERKRIYVLSYQSTPLLSIEHSKDQFQKNKSTRGNRL